MMNKSLNFISAVIDEFKDEKLQVTYTDEKLRFAKNNRFMKKYKALILDDEVYGRENLALMLETRFEDVEIVGKASDVEEAEEIIQKIVPDILFLDIRLENGTGFDLLDKFPEKNIATIIVSGYEQYGITALKYGVVDYILKPIGEEELKKAVGKAKLFNSNSITDIKKEGKKEVDKLKISTFNGFTLIEIKDILRLESDSNYTQVHLVDGSKLIVSKTMKEFEPFLSEDSFFRIHRSHIINTNFIKGYNSKEGGYVVLKDDSMVEVSRSKHKEFMELVASRFNSIS